MSPVDELNFQKELAKIINVYGVDSMLGISDYTLAQYCVRCIDCLPVVLNLAHKGRLPDDSAAVD